MAVVDNDYIPVKTADGTTKIYSVAKGTGCGVATIELTPDQLAALLNTLPATPDGYQAKTRICDGNTNPVVAVVDRTEYKAIPVIPPGSGPGTFGPSQITRSAHPERSSLKLSFEQIGGVWYGKVEEENTSRTPDPGNRRFWFLSGKKTPTASDNFTPKYFPQGTYLTTYYCEGPTDRFQQQGFTAKTQQFIYIGQPF